MPNALIINSNAVMCLSLSALLHSAGYTIVGETGDAQAALSLLRDIPVDLILIDCEIPEICAFDLVKRLRKHNDTIRILMMGNRKNQFNVRHAITSGVNGFIFTNDGIDTMKNAFHCVMAGYAFFPMQTGTPALSAHHEDAPAHDRLSVREIQILRQLTTGKKHIHIAEEMKISFKTVSTYKYRIMNKLRLCTTVELLEYARTQGI